MWADEDPELLARPILGALGARPAAELAGFSAPSRQLRTRLDEAEFSSDYTQVAYDLGIEERDAIHFGMAMARRVGHAEIVAVHHDNGITTQSAAAVAVYDTELGRIVAGPSLAADHETWSTFAPGSDHRVTQAIAALIGSMPGGRWMP
jgi:hypothetical protein